MDLDFGPAAEPHVTARGKEIGQTKLGDAARQVLTWANRQNGTRKIEARLADGSWRYWGFCSDCWLLSRTPS